MHSARTFTNTKCKEVNKHWQTGNPLFPGDFDRDLNKLTADLKSTMLSSLLLKFSYFNYLAPTNNYNRDGKNLLFTSAVS